MSVSSFKHKDKRPHIPSKEEAGYEQSNPKVQEKTSAEFPLNPVVHRGQDPELYWLNKYGNDNREELLKVDIRSLYRHEHISPEMLIKNLYRYTETNPDQLSLITEFNGMIKVEEAEKPGSYYKHQDDWRNRMILGDSLLTMTSLLEREGMAGKVQMVYMDPPYGIAYKSNWQMKLNNRTVGEKDEDVSGEPEVIKAYRDTWIDGIHTYLSYLRDRLLVVKELLTPSGSCFVQISDENVHLVRSVMDEVFGSENFVSLITFRRKINVMNPKYLGVVNDYLILYARDKENLKFRRLYKTQLPVLGDNWNYVDLPNGDRRKLTKEEIDNPATLPVGAKVFASYKLAPAGYNPSATFQVEYKGKLHNPPHTAGGRSWKTNETGMKRLIALNRVLPQGDTLRYVAYFEDFPYTEIDHSWEEMASTSDKSYVVQTAEETVKRCVLMTTDPGDLVLDPTCGSGTTAYVAEQWGRRWITTDTSRIALNIAKQRLMAAVLPYYKLYDEKGQDIRQGFIYKKVPHVTLESLANDEPAKEETLYDRPETDNKKLRVAGPFTVETLQSLNPLSPEELSQAHDTNDNFEQKVFDHLKSAGVKTGVKQEQAVFTRIEPLTSPYLHAEGFYHSKKGERKAYIHIGPKFGTVSKAAVNEAIKECRTRGDADWLLILGFSFESDVASQNITTNFGSFEVSKIRMHDDLMQEGLLKKDKKAASFVTIAEPDIKVHKKGKQAQVEIQGLDIYDPIKDEVKPRDIHDIAYWMLDDDYDGSNFIVRQAFFCGSDSKDEFENWKKGLSKLAIAGTKKKAESALRVEIDDEAFERLYGHISHPIEVKKKGQKIAVRVISQFGEESMKVLGV
jgi:adenine-specific DNA-methyltransferase